MGEIAGGGGLEETSGEKACDREEVGGMGQGV